MSDSPFIEPVWAEIITGKVAIDFEFLAAKILRSTLARTLAKDPSPARLQKCARDLRELLMQNADLPSVRKDLQKILG